MRIRFFEGIEMLTYLFDRELILGHLAVEYRTHNLKGFNLLPRECV